MTNILKQREEAIKEAIETLAGDSNDAEHDALVGMVRAFTSPHTKDSDCTIDEDTACCVVCGVDHSEECLECGGRGYHKDTCSTMAEVDIPAVDDSVKCCPDCEKPNQFGELCAECLREEQERIEEDRQPDYGGAFDGVRVTSDADSGL